MDHRRREEFPVIFWEFFHDQSKDITPEIKKLEENVRLLKHSIEYIHTGPFIRKEDIFQNYSLDERRKMIFS